MCPPMSPDDYRYQVAWDRSAWLILGIGALIAVGAFALGLCL